MSRQNIYQTLSVAAMMPPALIQGTLDTLIAQRAFLLNADERAALFRTRAMGGSYLSELVHRLVVLGKDQAFGLLRLPKKSVGLRESIDWTFLPLDVKQMKEMTSSSSTALSVLPELHDKLIINISDITRSTGDFSDITQFHYRVVRDFLSRSFFTSPGNVWINPALVRYVAKVYSMTIGGQIALAYGLSPALQRFIQTVFCAFFVAKMTSNEVVSGFMKAQGPQMSLGDSLQIQQIMGYIEDTLGKTAPETLEEMCQVIDAYDHVALKTDAGSRLSRRELNMKFSRIGPEGHVSMIALEYPPYFLFLILLVLSNIPIGLSYSMKQMNLVTSGKDVIDQLLASSTLTQGI